MRKIILVFSLLITIVNFIILVIALTIDSSIFYNNRFVIGLSFVTFGGFLRKQLLSFNKRNLKKVK
jgi:hypothetical protein